MEFLPYLIVLVVVAANSVAAYIINRKRVALDLATDDGRKKDKSYRLVITLLAVDTVIISAVILIFLKPMLAQLPQ